MSATELRHRIKCLISENDRLTAEINRLRDLIDCGCNALTDSICVSGNDHKTNMTWVRRLQAEAEKGLGE